MLPFLLRYVMEINLNGILNQIVGVCVGGLCTYLWAALKEKKMENEALKSGVQALLRDRIIQLHDFYMKDGAMPIHSKSNLENLHKNYAKLGANGVIDSIYQEAMKLPTK